MSLFGSETLPADLFKKLAIYGTYVTYSFKLTTDSEKADNELEYLTDSLCSSNYFSEYLDWGEDYQFTHDGKGNGELVIKIQCADEYSEPFGDYVSELAMSEFKSYTRLLPTIPNNTELSTFVRNLSMLLYDHKRACNHIISNIRFGTIDKLLSNEPIEFDPSIRCIVCYIYHPLIKGVRNFEDTKTLYCSKCNEMYKDNNAGVHMDNYNRYLRYLVGIHTIEFDEIIDFIKTPIPNVMELAGAHISENGLDRRNVVLTLE